MILTNKMSKGTAAFYVRGFSPPFNEGYLQVARAFVKIYNSMGWSVALFNFKYDTFNHPKSERFKSDKNFRYYYELKVPFVNREILLHAHNLGLIIFSTIFESAYSFKFSFAEAVIKRGSASHITHIINCFKYPRILAKKSIKSPIVVHQYHHKFLLSPILREALKKVDAIICSSNFIARVIGTLTEGAILTTIYPPVDVSFYKPMSKARARAILSLPMKDKIVLYLGNLNRERFPNEILFTVKEVALNAKDILLLIVAPVTPVNITRKSELMKLAKTLNIHKYVKIIITNLLERKKPVLYNAADMFLFFPTTHAGVAIEPPLAVLEAMSCGVIVVSTRTSSLSELIKDGENGLLVERHNFSGLNNKLCDMFAFSSSKIHDMSKNARRTIIEKASFNVAQNKLIALHELLSPSATV